MEEDDEEKEVDVSDREQEAMIWMVDEQRAMMTQMVVVVGSQSQWQGQ
jgi:hypothetical protein